MPDLLAILAVDTLRRGSEHPGAFVQAQVFKDRVALQLERLCRSIRQSQPKMILLLSTIDTKQLTARRSDVKKSSINAERNDRACDVWMASTSPVGCQWSHAPRAPARRASESDDAMSMRGVIRGGVRGDRLRAVRQSGLTLPRWPPPAAPQNHSLSAGIFHDCALGPKPSL